MSVAEGEHNFVLVAFCSCFFPVFSGGMGLIVLPNLNSK